MTKERTLGVHLEKLKPAEKGFIVWTLNFTNSLGYDVHQGMLPFIPVDVVLAVLDDVHIKSRGRMASQIRGKLRTAYSISDAVTFQMKLDPRKIAKRFGAHPERGHKIPNVVKKRVTVGVRWSLPHRDHVPDDNVLVEPHVVLKPAFGIGWWQIQCESRYQETVRQYLMDYCL